MRPRFEHVSPDQVLHVARVAHRQARALRGARRDPLGARREGRRAQPHAQPRAWPIAIRRGPPTASGSRGSRTRTASTPCTSARPTASGRRRRSDLGDALVLLLAALVARQQEGGARRDKRLNLWLVDIDHPTPVKVDTDRFEGSSFDPDVVARLAVDRVRQAARQPPARRLRLLGGRQEDPPDHRRARARRRAALRPRRQVPLVPREHRRRASATATGMMSAWASPSTSNVYAVVLQKEQASPVAPESDEEGRAGLAAEGQGEGKKEQGEGRRRRQGQG